METCVLDKIETLHGQAQGDSFMNAHGMKENKQAGILAVPILAVPGMVLCLEIGLAYF